MASRLKTSLRLLAGRRRPRERTAPPGRHVVLYDGDCPFCSSQIRRLLALAKRGALEALSIRDPSIPERFPGLSAEALAREMHLVLPDGRVVAGFEAAVRAVATRPFPGALAYLYYVPGLRQLFDFAYAAIARNRYRIFGRKPCPDAWCSRHGGTSPPAHGP